MVRLSEEVSLLQGGEMRETPRYVLLDLETGKYGILKGARPPVKRWLVEGEDFQFCQGEMIFDG